MRGEIFPQRRGRTLVKQYAHSSRFQALDGMLQYDPGLFQADAGKPLHEIGQQRAVFNILKQCGDRHTGATKHPRAADELWVAFNRRARRPVNHGVMLRPCSERREPIRRFDQP